jgi:hypothetical protein
MPTVFSTTLGVIMREEPPKIKEMVGKLEKVHGDSPSTY